jgi:hypothetical protein
MDEASTAAALVSYATPSFGDSFDLSLLEPVTVNRVNGESVALTSLLRDRRVILVLGRNLL